MRRVSLVLLALTSLTLFGCDALRDAFSPRADVVARANDQTLTVERLAARAGQSKKGPLAPPAPEAVPPLAQGRTAGARFAQLASRYSEDPASKVEGGSLGVSTRGQFVPEFDDVAWRLAPGGVSPLVKTQFGYHIIRRPLLAEVRD